MTLNQCLASLRNLNYPDFETIVVDDGSSDPSAAIAEQAGVRTIRLEHRGLAAARNAGARAASGEVIAFLDADAEADRDWLYHLVETIGRRDAAAAGGPNFAPEPRSAIAAAFDAAPGTPCEVRAGDDLLAQLCGCNMAIRKSALAEIGGFDPEFTAAGDDVDLSWRLAEGGRTLAFAPGATVTHQRRQTIGAYLKQQIGYGAGEGLLFRRYPLRAGGDDRIYGRGSWLGAIAASPRVYYGAFGRGLFQSAYTSGSSLFTELPLSLYWIAISIVMLIFGSASRLLLVLAVAGLAATIMAALARAAFTPISRRFGGPIARGWLVVLSLAGPIARSVARERIRWRLGSARTAGIEESGFEASGSFKFGSATDPNLNDAASLLSAMCSALVRRGLAVAVTDGFQSYDLEVVAPPALRVPINAVRARDGTMSLRWRVRITSRAPLIAGAGALLVLLAAGLSIRDAILAVAAASVAFALIAFGRVRRIPPILRASAADASDALKLHLSASEVVETL